MVGIFLVGAILLPMQTIWPALVIHLHPISLLMSADDAADEQAQTREMI